MNEYKVWQHNNPENTIQTIHAETIGEAISLCAKSSLSSISNYDAKVIKETKKKKPKKLKFKGTLSFNKDVNY